MVEAMKKVAKLDVELTVEERNLLSVAYKNVIGARRASWRIISSIEQKEESKGADDKLEMIRTYRSQVEKELRDICSDILDVLDKHLIPAASTGESKVGFGKIQYLTPNRSRCFTKSKLICGVIECVLRTDDDWLRRSGHPAAPADPGRPVVPAGRAAATCCAG